jgi:outer membrane lipoprotein-sorting protein
MGQTTRIEFTDTQRNGPVPAERFRFSPPPGVDVIRAAPQAPSS